MPSRKKQVSWYPDPEIRTVYEKVSAQMGMSLAKLVDHILVSNAPMLAEVGRAMESLTDGNPLAGALLFQSYLEGAQQEANQMMQEVREFGARATPEERGEAS